MKNKLFRAAASALLTLLLVVTLLPVQAHAAGATLTGTAAPQAGDTVTLTLSVPSKVYGLTADLSYSGNLSFTNYNCSVSGWSIVVNNNKFSVYGTSSSSGGLVTIKMKVSGSAKEGDALTATFSNIVVSDGNSDTSLDSASWSGKVGAAPSGNCSLSSLSCSNATLSPSFSSSTTYYTCTVPFAVEKLDLNYKKADNSATVSVSGNELAVGVNTGGQRRHQELYHRCHAPAGPQLQTLHRRVHRRPDAGGGHAVSGVHAHGDGLHRLRPL